MASTPLHSWYGYSVGMPPYTTIDANGNVAANYAHFANLTTNVATVSNTLTVAGNLNVTGTITGTISANITGNLSVPGKDTWLVYVLGGNACSSSNLTFVDSTTGGFLHAMGNACIDRNLSVSGTISGNGSGLTNVQAQTAQYVVASSQPNITSTGNLVSLTMAPNGVANLGNATTLRIGGGNSGQTLIARGNGVVGWGYTDRIANGQSTVSIANINGPIRMSVANNAVVTVNPSNVIINGEVWTSGNIRANHFDGDGSRLNNINASNIVGNMSMSGSFTVLGRDTNKTITINRGQFGVGTRSGNIIITA